MTTQAECWEKRRASLEALVKGWQESNSDLVRTWKSKDIEDQQLRRWINEQRKGYRSELLPECREKALYDIPGWRWADHEEPWVDMLKRIRAWLQETAAGEILNDVAEEKPDMEQHSQCL